MLKFLKSWGWIGLTSNLILTLSLFAAEEKTPQPLIEEDRATIGFEGLSQTIVLPWSTLEQLTYFKILRTHNFLDSDPKQKVFLPLFIPNADLGEKDKEEALGEFKNILLKETYYFPSFRPQVRKYLDALFDYYHPRMPFDGLTCNKSPWLERLKEARLEQEFKEFIEGDLRFIEYARCCFLEALHDQQRCDPRLLLRIKILFYNKRLEHSVRIFMPAFCLTSTIENPEDITAPHLKQVAMDNIEGFLRYNDPDSKIVQPPLPSGELELDAYQQSPFPQLSDETKACCIAKLSLQYKGSCPSDGSLTFSSCF